MPGTESLLGHVACNIEAQSGVSSDDDETVVRRASISLTDSVRLPCPRFFGMRTVLLHASSLEQAISPAYRYLLTQLLILTMTLNLTLTLN